MISNLIKDTPENREAVEEANKKNEYLHNPDIVKTVLNVTQQRPPIYHEKQRSVLRGGKI